MIKMYRTIITILFVILLNSCITKPRVVEVYTSDTLTIKPVSNNTFVHTSYLQTEDFGNVPCNGMVHFNGDEAIIFDTPTTNEVSKELIDWVTQKHQKRIKAIVVTHFHEDCLGGLQAFHDYGATSFANAETLALIQQEKITTIPSIAFNDHMNIMVGEQLVQAHFFGEGHTSDNVVGYIPDEEVLFGGCLIKSVNASKGYLGDASPKQWSATVASIKKAYPNLKVVIPGHGASGDTALLDYTIELFKE